MIEALSAAVWVLVSVPVTVWTFKAVHWTVLGEVDPALGIFAILMGPLMGFLTIAQESPPVRVGMFVAITLTVVLFPIVSDKAQAHDKKRQDGEVMARAYENLGPYPDNVLVRLRIAEALVSRGFVPHGAAVAAVALEGKNPTQYGEEFRSLRMWDRMAKAHEPLTEVRCPGCKQAGPPGELHCRRCGEAIYVAYGGGSELGLVKRLASVWLTVLAALVGIPAASSALPPAWAIVCIVAMMGLGLFVVIRTFRRGAPARASAQ